MSQGICCDWKSIYYPDVSLTFSFIFLISSRTLIDCAKVIASGPFGISFCKQKSNRTRAKELACLIINKIFTGLHKIPRVDQLVVKYYRASSVLLLVYNIPSEAFFMMKTEISHRFAHNAADASALFAPPPMAGRYVSVGGRSREKVYICDRQQVP